MGVIPTSYQLLELPECASTQDELRRRVAEVDAVRAEMQHAGRGRHGRSWYASPGAGLALSILLRQWPASAPPWLAGMHLASIAGELLDTELQWPNDLVLDGRKVAGILTELVELDGRSVPLVGVGVNLRLPEIPPEIAHRATSLHLHRAQIPNAGSLAEELLDRLALADPPRSWADLAPQWSRRDATAGKKFALHDGRQGTAQGIASDGSLRVLVAGEVLSVLAADALFGRET